METITVPTEVILWRSTPATTKTKCLDIFAGMSPLPPASHVCPLADIDPFAIGGDLTMFEVERTDGSSMPQVDVLSCGNGQWGGLGNAQYSNAQSSPVRAKNVSGLFECEWVYS